MSESIVLRVDAVSKRFGPILANDAISLTLGEGGLSIGHAGGLLGCAAEDCRDGLPLVARSPHGGPRRQHSRELKIVNAYVDGLGRGGSQLALTVLELSRGRA